MTMKKKLLTTLSVVLILGLAALGILAYLSDTDSDVNVMTLGNVDIEQEEVFEQGADLYPGVTVQKEVSVKNVGESDAYVRTLVAFETIDAEGFSYVPTWADGVTAAKLTTIEKDGVQYDVYEVVYNDAVAPNTETSKSLMSVKLSEDCTNEHMEALGGTYEVLVLSQAVQVEGFADAQEALDAAFPKGDNNANVADWFDAVAMPTVVANANELEGILHLGADGAIIKLTEGVDYGEIYVGSGQGVTEVPKDITVIGAEGATLDLAVRSGFEISGWTFKNVNFSGGGVKITNEAVAKGITFDGCTFSGTTYMYIKEGSEDITITGCDFFGNGTQKAIYIQGAKNVTVTGCTFKNVTNAVNIGASGDIVVFGNKINGTTDRPLRFSTVDATILVSGNTIVSNGDDDGQLMKADGGITADKITLDGNTWNGKSDSEVSAGMDGDVYIVK